MPDDDYFRPPETRAALWRETGLLLALVGGLSLLLAVVVYLTER